MDPAGEGGFDVYAGGADGGARTIVGATSASAGRESAPVDA